MQEGGREEGREGGIEGERSETEEERANGGRWRVMSLMLDQTWGSPPIKRLIENSFPGSQFQEMGNNMHMPSLIKLVKSVQPLQDSVADLFSLCPTRSFYGHK